MGNPAPKFTFGFNNYFAYKGFDLNIFLNGSVGNKAVNLIRRTFTDPMRNSNLLKEATDIALIGMHDPEVAMKSSPTSISSMPTEPKYSVSHQ